MTSAASRSRRSWSFLTTRIAQVRSASLINATRTSSTIATSICLRLSFADWGCPSTAVVVNCCTSATSAIFNTPTTRASTDLPNCRRTDSTLRRCSRTARYNTPAHSACTSTFSSIRISAISRLSATKLDVCAQSLQSTPTRSDALCTQLKASDTNPAPDSEYSSVKRVCHTARSWPLIELISEDSRTQTIAINPRKLRSTNSDHRGHKQWLQ